MLIIFLLLNIFVETFILFSGLFNEHKCHNVLLFTVTFDQFNASLLN